jgi:Spy/CpxP family protein refolding chaperone
MRIVSSVLALAMSLSVAGAVLAQGGMGPAPVAPAKEKGQGDKAKTPEFSGPLSFLNGLDLTADQKSKVADVMKEYGPKLQDARKAMESIITPEQKKAREKAVKEAKAAGKTPREIFEAAREAMNLTEEQKTKGKEAMKAAAPVYREFQKKVVDILTDAQKEQLKKRWEEHRGKKPAESAL